MRRKVVWRRLDPPGTETATLYTLKRTWHLAGRVLTTMNEGPLQARYHIACDTEWRVRAATITVRGAPRGKLGLLAHPDGRWFLNGEEARDLRDCTDVDLTITPATNTLPIRRLRLATGASAVIAAAHVRFPDLVVARSRQEYSRVDERRYRFTSLDSGFTAELEVDHDGLVIHYPGGWTRELR